MPKPAFHHFAVSTLVFSLSCVVPPAFSQKVYSAKERQIEEARIRKEIEENLDWKNRAPEALDDVPDADRLLYSRVNESILLKKTTGERFGVFESFDDRDNTKTYEIRLHKKNKLRDRFLLFGDGCDSVGLAAKKVTKDFIIYTASCSSQKYGTSYTPYLFDYASRNFYQLVQLEYDALENPPPSISLEAGTYKMRWSVKLRRKKIPELILRNFKIQKDARGEWKVIELPPTDNEAVSIGPLSRLSVAPTYNLPEFISR